jgi:hypothetical protein
MQRTLRIYASVKFVGGALAHNPVLLRRHHLVCVCVCVCVCAHDLLLLRRRRLERLAQKSASLGFRV